MRSRWTRPWWTSTTPRRGKERQVKRNEESKKAKLPAKKRALKIVGKLTLFGFITFLVTFGIYMFNLENKLIYYVIRPFLNKHYDSQKRDRRIV